MYTKITKSLLMTALITGSVLCSNTEAFAQEEETESLKEFTLDQIVVTATRTEMKDLDVPASVEVFDEKRIEKSGASNVYDVVKNTLGVSSQSQGFNGTAMGTMTSKVMIRGVEKGTLVLVNGVRMNMDGKYNLEDIPTESVERIEVVKGGGAVLYGSEATGGVINIITKKHVKNKIRISAGNFGKEKYDLSLGADRFNMILGYENRGFADKMSGVVGTTTSSSTVYDYGKGERKSILWNYAITDGLTFTHSYSNNKHEYWQKYAKSKKRSRINYYEDEDNYFLLQYDKDGWKANVSYGTQEKGYDQSKYSNGVLASRSRYSSRKGHNTNVDIQKQLDLGRDKLLIGVSFQREDMDAFSSTDSVSSTYKRNVYSIYTSYDWKMSNKANLMINLRETVATNCEGLQKDLSSGNVTSVDNDNMSKFTPEAEYIYKLNENSTLYAKAGKSFRLPNLTQLYGSGIINPALNIKPEQGTHFEIGYKLQLDKQAWRIALFNYKIKDSIDADVTYNSDGSIDFVDYFNENVRNTGLEVSVEITHDDKFSSTWGVMYQRPQAQNSNTYGDNDYHDIYNRYQLQSTLNYHDNKFTGMISVNFVGNRTSTRASSSKPERHLRPQCFTDLHLTYSPEKDHKFFFHLNNIFDRLDITTNSSSNYFSLGRNFMIGYEYSF